MIDERYAAGFFDGEGTVSIRVHRVKVRGRRYPHHRLHAVVAQRDTAVLYLFAERWGGSVKETTSAKVGYWRVADKLAERFLRDVVEHLVVKRYQAEIALSFREKVKANERKLVSVEEFEERAYMARMVSELKR